MCTYNQCFRARKKKIYIFSSENYYFYSREVLLYIAWACLCNDLRQDFQMLLAVYRGKTQSLQYSLSHTYSNITANKIYSIKTNQ